MALVKDMHIKPEPPTEATLLAVLRQHWQADPEKIRFPDKVDEELARDLAIYHAPDAIFPLAALGVDFNVEDDTTHNHMAPLRAALLDASFQKVDPKLKAARHILELGANPDVVSGHSRHPLLCDVLPHPDRVRLLLEFGANPDVGEFPGYSPLLHLVLKPDVWNTDVCEAATGCAHLLLDAGARVGPGYRDKDGKDYSILPMAIARHPLLPDSLVRRLLDETPKEFFAPDALDWVMVAGLLARQGREELLVHALELGCPVGGTDNYGKTALDYFLFCSSPLAPPAQACAWRLIAAGVRLGPPGPHESAVARASLEALVLDVACQAALDEACADPAVPHLPRPRL
jgi:hypothetical protein